MVVGTREVAHVRGHAEAGVAAGVVRCRMIDWRSVNHSTSDDGSLTMAAQYLEYLRSLKIASSPFDATQSGFEQSSPYPQLRSVDHGSHGQLIVKGNTKDMELTAQIRFG